MAPGCSTAWGAGLWVNTVCGTLTVVVVTGAVVAVVAELEVVDVVVVLMVVDVVVVAAGLPTEKHAQVRPTAWMACRAAPKVRPTTAGTSTASPKQPDQLMPTRVPGETATPGLTGTAPTRTSGGFPARASDATTLWLARVPLLHGVFRFTDVNPAARRAAWAAVIFRPMTFGTATPGCVVVDDGAEVEVVGGAAVVVVRMLRTAFFCAAVGPLLHDARRLAAITAAHPSGTTRPPNGTAPSWFVESCGAAGRTASGSYFKMLTARATTRMATTREMASSAIIMSFIQGLTAETSVGLKAVAVAKAKWK